ncbi:MAG: hypothetical protein REI78_09780 [Pedobacter sp.]|nr:hypothetical protein [Pedobacter sp.]MDQ8053305.1 hypothetical protein [Pedobacter sp.]
MANDKNSYSYWYRNGLTLVFVILFMGTWCAQALTGFNVHNEALQENGKALLSFSDYLCSGHFISATFENFESEFLQMFLYVLLTVKLRQIGSAESKSLSEKEEVDRMPKAAKDAPWPVKQGGWILKLYQNSLSICFGILFLTSWALHFYGSWQDYNIEQRIKGLPQETPIAYICNANFWFETFQNWQSEFLSVASIVFLTIYLRQKGSPESKPVDAPHMETGK